MTAKVRAAQFALTLGIPVFIGNLDSGERLLDVLADRGNGTYIGDARAAALNRKKQWIAFHSPSAGSITIDDGTWVPLTNISCVWSERYEEMKRAVEAEP